MTTPYDTSTVAVLIGSRICHDLISPIGAITNGLELLELSGMPRTPELALVSQSVSHANARIRLFRLAFGQCSDGQMTGGDEVRSILHDLYGESRTHCHGFPTGSFARSEIRLVLLALLCVEQAIPQGGEIAITRMNQGWRLTVTGPRLVTTSQAWSALADGATPAEITPAMVQFLLLPTFAAENDMTYAVELTDSKLEIAISLA